MEWKISQRVIIHSTRKKNEEALFTYQLANDNQKIKTKKKHTLKRSWFSYQSVIKRVHTRYSVVSFSFYGDPGGFRCFLFALRVHELRDTNSQYYQPPVCLITWLVENCTGIAKIMGSFQVPFKHEFSRFHFATQCLSSAHNCGDLRNTMMTAPFH